MYRDSHYDKRESSLRNGITEIRPRPMRQTRRSLLDPCQTLEKHEGTTLKSRTKNALLNQPMRCGKSASEMGVMVRASNTRKEEEFVGAPRRARRCLPLDTSWAHSRRAPRWYRHCACAGPNCRSPGHCASTLRRSRCSKASHSSLG